MSISLLRPKGMRVTLTEQPNTIAYVFEAQTLAFQQQHKRPQATPQVCITRNHCKYLTHCKPTAAIYQDEISHAIRE
jgi:hypothetical protein